MNMNASLALLLGSLLAAQCLTGCQRHDSTSQNTNQPAISGTLQTQQPVTLQAPARLELQLTDVSSSEGQSVVVAKTTLNDIQRLPVAYSLPYDADRINEKHRYMVEARLYANNVLRYATDTPHAALTQGNGNQVDVVVVAVGEASKATISTPMQAGNFVQGELRTADGATLYRAAMQGSSISWLDEERSNKTPQPLQARYEFKGALLQRYQDGSGIEIVFDERGRPERLSRNGKPAELKQEADLISAVRNRAELLRAHALARHETQAHREATENWQGSAGLTNFGSTSQSTTH